MLKVRQIDESGSTIILGKPMEVPNFRASVYSPSTSAVPTAGGYEVNVLPISTLPMKCEVVFLSNRGAIVSDCTPMGRTSITDVIAKYTATEEGRKAFAKAERDLHAELKKKMHAGKISPLKYFRLIKNMDQLTLAKLSGIKQPNLSRLEKPGHRGDIASYKKLAKVLGVDFKELLP